MRKMEPEVGPNTPANETVDGHVCPKLHAKQFDAPETYNKSRQRTQSYVTVLENSEKKKKKKANHSYILKISTFDLECLNRYFKSSG